MHKHSLSSLFIVLAVPICVFADVAAPVFPDSPGTATVFPVDAGVVDLTQPPYGIKGDGKTDCTAGIQKALDDTAGGLKILYFPKGVYLVSDTLKWGFGGGAGGRLWKQQIFQGESREGSVIKLRDRCPGFTNPREPRGVVWTGLKPAQRFRNAVRNLTIDTGAGNPGAIALQFNTSNQGCVDNVTLRGEGPIGLDLAYTTEVGPLLVKNVLVDGFDIGIKTGASNVNSATFEFVELRNQKRLGFLNEGQCVSIRKLVSRNTCPAILNRTSPGLVTLLDSELVALPGTQGAAIENHGALFARDVATRGYARAVVNKAGHRRGLLGPVIGEFVSHEPLALFDVPRRSLRLPVEETPVVPLDPPSEWANIAQFGGVVNDGKDDSEALQKAIDSGKGTVYLPNGTWNLDQTVIVRGKVRRVIGCEAKIEILPELKAQEKPVFRIEDGQAPVVVFERLQGNPWEGAPCYWFDQATRRTLVIKNTTLFVANAYRNSVSGGKLFIEDVSCQTGGAGRWVFTGQTVFARQFDVETHGTKIVNDGGTFWMLGYKTERGGTLLETRNGGRTELLGGFAYALSEPKTEPMFVNTDATTTLILGESAYDWGKPFLDVVKETRGSETRILKRGEAPERDNGTVLPLYVGGPFIALNVSAPTAVQATAISSTEINLTWESPAPAGPAGGEFVVRRDGKEIGMTADLCFTDGNLKEGQTCTVQVGHRASAKGEAVFAAEVKVTTPPDTTPPAIVGARLLNYPPRIVVSFSKPLDPATAADGKNYRCDPVQAFTGVRLLADGATVELALKSLPTAEDLGLHAEGVRDLAAKPNALPATTVKVAPAPQDQIVMLNDYDKDELGSVAGVGDNSDWKGGKVTARVVADGNGRALECQVSKFGQATLAWPKLQGGRMNVVSADVRSSKPNQNVTLQVRQWDTPYTVHGGGSFVVGPETTHASFAFYAQGDNSVPIFMITEGDVTLTVDNLRLATYRSE